MSTTTAEVLLRPASEELRFLPEGPYPVRPGVISWVAIQHGPEGRAGSLNLLDLKTRENESYKLPGRPGFAFSCSDGKSFVVGCERSLGIFEPTSGSWRVLCDGIDAQVTGTIINDAVVFEDYLIFGCKDLKFQEAKAGLYLWDARRNRLTQLRNDQTCSNGKSVRRLPNGDCELIDIDTPTRQVAAYTIDFERGELGPRRVVLDLTKAVGFPDGAILTPDERSIIISFYNPDPAPAGETRMYDLQTGALQHTWLTPGSPQATCPQLVSHGEGYVLVITTAVEFMPAERRSGAPEAGSLFVAKTSFKAPAAAPAYRL